MSGTYPHCNSSYTHEELVEHFLLTPADLQLIWTCRGEANRCGMALLLRALTYLGYVPDSLDSVPPRSARASPGNWVCCGMSPRPIRGIAARAASIGLPSG